MNHYTNSLTEQEMYVQEEKKLEDLAEEPDIDSGDLKKESHTHPSY